MKRIAFRSAGNSYEVSLFDDSKNRVEIMTKSMIARGYSDIEVRDSNVSVWDEVDDENQTVFVLTKNDSDGQHPLPVAGSVHATSVESFQRGVSFLSAEANQYQIEQMLPPT